MVWVYNASPAVNAESNYPTIIGVSIPLLVLMLIVVCLRLYVRLRMVNFAGLDDWVIVAGAVCRSFPRYFALLTSSDLQHNL